MEKEKLKKIINVLPDDDIHILFIVANSIVNSKYSANGKQVPCDTEHLLVPDLTLK